MKKRAALIIKDEPSSWKSCQLITSNLHKTYENVLKDFDLKVYKVPENLNTFSAFQVAKEIKKDSIELIIWLDHKPNAAIFMGALDIIYKDIILENRPKILIYLFGDFVLDCLAWRSAEKAISNFNIHFIAASEKQKKLVESFFIFSNTESISVMPFPVDNEKFYYDNSSHLRKTFREKFNIADDDLVFLYTGRVSYQKNIEALVKVFSTSLNLFPMKAHLLIAGDWDDILVPYSGKVGQLGSYFSQFNLTTKKYLNTQIQFLGNIDEGLLLSAYNAADLFVSFSTYNDEDYGMSVAEALCCGLPCLLSNWGGFNTFGNKFSDVELLPINFDNFRPMINLAYSRKKMIDLSHMLKNKNINKQVRSQDAAAALSIKGLSSKLELNFNNIKFGTVTDFSERFVKLCRLSEINPGAPFKKGKNCELSEFYKEVYENYGN